MMDLITDMKKGGEETKQHDAHQVRTCHICTSHNAADCQLQHRHFFHRFIFECSTRALITHAGFSLRIADAAA